jgi:site-specific DNA-cytosine methylase
MIYRESSFGTYAEGGAGTLRASGGNNGGGSETLIVLNDQGGDSMNIEKTSISPTLRAEAHNNNPIVFHTMQDPIASEAVTPCISAGSPQGQAAVGVSVDYTVRRLTPLECERLQGFPDYWTDIGAWTDEQGKDHTESGDSARYKAIGNSIALPPWEYVLQRLTLCCGADVTMASLFDGIGGFPLIWERLNGNGACLWASEIEDFPIAVTKRHFSEEHANED